ncbi:MAG: hypothetical protein U5L96_11675 [Owenweeksia sp.]|nr:hypothetical protein [Owenweeksia sp.]
MHLFSGGKTGSDQGYIVHTSENSNPAPDGEKIVKPLAMGRGILPVVGASFIFARSECCNESLLPDRLPVEYKFPDAGRFAASFHCFANIGLLPD